ncbi:MAG TPA: glucose-6-phosphate dehydrogenase [Myxococcaceae bacterium]|nr:glucose-6-phosphate dehydrogenase [Myxococcaceae bacterium]
MTAAASASGGEVRVGDPCLVIIFGASGDLTQRKLVPALFNLQAQGFLPRDIGVVGVARSEMSHAAFREKVKPEEKALASDEARRAWATLSERVFYQAADASRPESFPALRETLAGLDRQLRTPGNYMFYLSVAPEYFAPIVQGLGKAGLLEEKGGRWRRVVIEKPFGHDLPSAIQLNQDLRQVISERQIFRIDHYLGKETVQNLLVFRFGNSIFEPIWSHHYIDHVQVTAAEELGVEARGGYYDGAGALRDMVPNHIAQLVSLVAMEPPISFHADAVRDEQVKLLKSIQPLSPEDVLHAAVRGQYGPGQVKGQKVPGYREEGKVAPASTTDTFVALRVSIDNWRWAHVPFYVRTGKRMPKRVTEIVIQFKTPPFMLFTRTPVSHLTTNRLFVRIQPDEGISLRFGAKVPGPILEMGAVKMDFRYVDWFGAKPSTGYETLLYDAMVGDATLFQRADMVEAGWRMVQPLIDVWKALPPRDFPNYPAGSWGPAEADALLERDGRHWENGET